MSIAALRGLHRQDHVQDRHRTSGPDLAIDQPNPPRRRTGEGRAAPAVIFLRVNLARRTDARRARRVDLRTACRPILRRSRQSRRGSVEAPAAPPSTDAIRPNSSAPNRPQNALPDRSAALSAPTRALSAASCARICISVICSRYWASSRSTTSPASDCDRPVSSVSAFASVSRSQRPAPSPALAARRAAVLDGGHRDRRLPARHEPLVDRPQRLADVQRQRRSGSARRRLDRCRRRVVAANRPPARPCATPDTIVDSTATISAPPKIVVRLQTTSP